MRTTTVILSAVLTATLGAAPTRAATPFGGDDAGFVPPDKFVAKCEDGVSKQVSKLTGALIKCNIKDSDLHVKNKPFDGAACQATAAGKYDTLVGKLNAQGIRPACLDPTAQTGLRDLTSTLVNLNGGVVFCDNTSGTPQDSPDTGFVPNDKVVQKCEDLTAKNASTLVGAIVKCHVKAADLGLKGKPFDEEGCEATAKGKYDAKAAKFVGCPTCLNGAGLAALRDLVESLLDSNNGGAYCASPSGAFLD